MVRLPQDICTSPTYLADEEVPAVMNSHRLPSIAGHATLLVAIAPEDRDFANVDRKSF